MGDLYLKAIAAANWLRHFVNSLSMQGFKHLASSVGVAKGGIGENLMVLH